MQGCASVNGTQSPTALFSVGTTEWTKKGTTSGMARVSGGASLDAGTATADAPPEKKSSRPSFGPSNAGCIKTARHVNSLRVTPAGDEFGFRVQGMRAPPGAVRLTAMMLLPTLGAFMPILPRHGTGCTGDATERVLGSSDALKTSRRGSGGVGASVSTAGSPSQ